MPPVLKVTLTTEKREVGVPALMRSWGSTNISWIPNKKFTFVFEQQPLPRLPVTKLGVSRRPSSVGRGAPLEPVPTTTTAVASEAGPSRPASVSLLDPRSLLDEVYSSSEDEAPAIPATSGAAAAPTEEEPFFQDAQDMEAEPVNTAALNLETISALTRLANQLTASAVQDEVRVPRRYRRPRRRRSRPYNREVVRRHTGAHMVPGSNIIRWFHCPLGTPRSITRALTCRRIRFDWSTPLDMTDDEQAGELDCLSRYLIREARGRLFLNRKNKMKWQGTDHSYAAVSFFFFMISEPAGVSIEDYIIDMFHAALESAQEAGAVRQDVIRDIIELDIIDNPEVLDDHEDEEDEA